MASKSAHQSARTVRYDAATAFRKGADAPRTRTDLQEIEVSINEGIAARFRIISLQDVRTSGSRRKIGAQPVTSAN